MSIPASELVSVTPSVLAAGGNPLALNGVVLSTYAGLPVGAPVSLPSTVAVGGYFGAGSTEAAIASTYFNGYSISTTKPNTLLFSRYATAPIAAFARGAANTMTLAEITALGTTGSLLVVVDGTPATCSNVNLSAASSFADAATKITAGFTGTTKPTVTYDTTFGAFVMTSGTTGALSTITYATGNLATGLKFTAATGGIISQGSAIKTPAETMAAIVAFTQNWVSFMTVAEPALATKKLFATWLASTGKRFVYSCWDTNVLAIGTVANDSVSRAAVFGTWLTDQAIDGVCVTYNTVQLAAFVMGFIASINFSATNGRATLAYKSGDGVTYTVSDATQAQNLEANGYNFYGSYATANDSFTFMQPGSVSGEYAFLDSYVNAIWLNNQLQLANLGLLVSVPAVPYNSEGYAMLKAAAQDPIDAAVTFGAIQEGVALSASQIAAVNAAAGVQIDTTLSTRGWYYQVLPATPQVRALRGTPPCNLWYMDGESVQKLNVASTVIR